MKLGFCQALGKHPPLADGKVEPAVAKAMAGGQVSRRQVKEKTGLLLCEGTGEAGFCSL